MHLDFLKTCIIDIIICKKISLGWLPMLANILSPYQTIFQNVKIFITKTFNIWVAQTWHHDSWTIHEKSFIITCFQTISQQKLTPEKQTWSSQLKIHSEDGGGVSLWGTPHEYEPTLTSAIIFDKWSWWWCSYTSRPDPSRYCCTLPSLHYLISILFAEDGLQEPITNKPERKFLSAK